MQVGRTHLSYFISNSLLISHEPRFQGLNLLDLMMIEAKATWHRVSVRISLQDTTQFPCYPTTQFYSPSYYFNYQNKISGRRDILVAQTASKTSISTEIYTFDSLTLSLTVRPQQDKGRRRQLCDHHMADGTEKSIPLFHR